MTVVRRAILTPSIKATSIACRADRRATHAPNNTNGIAERFHKTVLNEFYRVAFRKRIYASIEELQGDLDVWMREYNEARSHQGRWCYGKTPMATFLDTAHVARDKLLPAA